MKLKKLLVSGVLVGSMVLSAVTAFAQHTTLDEYGQEWDGYTSTTTISFKDVPRTHWAFENIDRVVAKGWFDGYPDGTFHPDDSVKRSEAMTVFMKFLGIKPAASVSSTSYSDVSTSDWYAPYIEAGKDLFPEKRAYNGETPFLPEQPIIREDVCYALVKAKGYEPLTVNADQSVLRMFKDSNGISRDMKPYVAVAVSVGLISGYDDGTIGAQDPLTRAEFATMLYRATYIGTN